MIGKFMSLPYKYGLGMSISWIVWHWGLLMFGMLPYPQPRLAVMYSALAIDGLCFLYFFAWTFYYSHKLPPRTKVND